MANVNMANREVCNLVFVDYQTKAPFLNVDYANVSTAGLTGESVYAYGGWGHPRRITFYGDRSGTIGFETQITPFKLYSLITGGEVEDTATWLKREEVTASNNGITISDTSVSDVTVFVADDDCGTELADVSVSSGVITGTGITDGTKYVVYYTQNLTSVQRITVTSTTFPQYFTAYMETEDVTEDGEKKLFRMVAYKCAPQAEVSLEFSNSGDPATLSITCDLMADDDDNILDLLLVDDESGE